MIVSACSAEWRGSRINSRQVLYSFVSQRFSIKALSSRPSLTITCANAFINATLVPGFNGKCSEFLNVAYLIYQYVLDQQQLTLHLDVNVFSSMRQKRDEHQLD